MSDKNILFTGGSGLLGKEIQKLFPDSHFPSSKELDVGDREQVLKFFENLSDPIDAIVHLAAFTSPPRIEADPLRAIRDNIVGTANIVEVCMKKNYRLVYTSTDYVFKGDKGRYKETDPVYPVNKYSWSKLGGECAVRIYNRALIIRLSISEMEFPFEKAFIDQWTTREPVNSGAEKIAKLIRLKDLYGTIHIGSERRTVYEYAKFLSPNKTIGELKRSDLKVEIPKDVSLDSSKYDQLMKEEKN